MKIRQLLETDDDALTWEKSSLKRRLDSGDDDVDLAHAVHEVRKKSPTHQFLNAGINAYVGKHNTPHAANEVERVSSADDATVAYLRAIAFNPTIQQNPYIPRILKQQIKNQIAHFTVERLYDFEHPMVGTEDTLRALNERIFVRPLTLTFSKKLTVRSPVILIAGAIENITAKMEFEKIADPQLVEALKFICDIKDRLEADLDIHDGNIMWRITGNMPQLVITDPLVI